MAACVRAFLTLLFVANVRSGLLPIDLSGVSSSGLLNLGLNTPNGGLLSSLGNVISTGVSTIESLGTAVLGNLTPLPNGYNIEPKSTILYLEPWQLDSSYAAYKKNVHPISMDGHRPISYAEWINIIHGDLESVHYNDPVSIESPAKHDVDDAIQVPGSDKIVKQPSIDNGKVILHTPNVATTPTPGSNSGQIIILQPSGNQQLNVNGVYVMPTIGSNLGNQGIGVPNIPTVYKDNQGNLYYIIQPNVNQVNQPIQPIPSNKQSYVTMSYNGQQVLVPVSLLAENPLETARKYVYVSANNIQSQNPANPVVSYVTTPKYESFEKLPEVADPVIQEGSIPRDSKKGVVDSTRDESEAVDETDGSALRGDIKK